jgi:hypothetical protein
MIRREINLDEESDQILSGLAEDYEGDRGKALADLLHAHEGIEEFVGECEEAHRESLIAQRSSDRTIPWEEVKRRHDL